MVTPEGSAATVERRNRSLMRSILLALRDGEDFDRCLTEANALLGLAANGTPIREWQARAAEWTDSRFPDDDLKQRGLVLGEETGEVLRCILKAEQNIRGGRDHWMTELRKETVDVFFALAHRAGFDLADAIEGEWERLNAKTYGEATSIAP